MAEALTSAAVADIFDADTSSLRHQLRRLETLLRHDGGVSDLDHIRRHHDCVRLELEERGASECVLLRAQSPREDPSLRQPQAGEPPSSDSVSNEPASHKTLLQRMAESQLEERRRLAALRQERAAREAEEAQVEAAAQRVAAEKVAAAQKAALERTRRKATERKAASGVANSEAHRSGVKRAASARGQARRPSQLCLVKAQRATSAPPKPRTAPQIAGATREMLTRSGEVVSADSSRNAAVARRNHEANDACERSEPKESGDAKARKSPSLEATLKTTSSFSQARQRAALRVQAITRGCVARHSFHRRRFAALVLQRWTQKRFSCRRLGSTGCVQAAHLSACVDAATSIQAAERGRATRRELDRRRLSALLIQKFERRHRPQSSTGEAASSLRDREAAEVFQAVDQLAAAGRQQLLAFAAAAESEPESEPEGEPADEPLSEPRSEPQCESAVCGTQGAACGESTSVNATSGSPLCVSTAIARLRRMYPEAPLVKLEAAFADGAENSSVQNNGSWSSFARPASALYRSVIVGRGAAQARRWRGKATGGTSKAAREQSRTLLARYGRFDDIFCNSSGAPSGLPPSTELLQQHARACAAWEPRLVEAFGAVPQPEWAHRYIRVAQAIPEVEAIVRDLCGSTKGDPIPSVGMRWLELPESAEATAGWDVLWTWKVVAPLNSRPYHYSRHVTSPLREPSFPLSVPLARRHQR